MQNGLAERETEGIKTVVASDEDELPVLNALGSNRSGYLLREGCLNGRTNTHGENTLGRERRVGIDVLAILVRQCDGNHTSLIAVIINDYAKTAVGV